MPFDGIFAAAIAAELKQTIVGARIDKIFQPTPDTLVVHCRKPGDTYKLLLSAHPRYARVHLTDARPVNPLRAPVFCMTLRKHLDPGRIAAVDQQGLDRILRIHVDCFDEIGRPARRLLIAELTGRHGNIVLVDEGSGRIIDALKRANRRVNTYRALLPGEEYVPPPAGDKIDPRGLSISELTDVIVRGVDEDPTSPAEHIEGLAAQLPRRFEGVSPFAAEETLARAYRFQGAPGVRLAQSLWDLMHRVRQGRFEGTVRRDAQGAMTDVWAFVPRQWEPEGCQKYNGVNAAADAFYTDRLAAETLDATRRGLQRGVNTARKRLLRKASALEKDLEDAARADEYRIFGELLTANMHLVGRSSEARVPNYYDNGELISIPLDPTLGPAANAQRYFKRYSKLKTAANVVQEQLDETLADIAWLDQAAVHLQMAGTEEQLDELARELIASGMMPRNVMAMARREGPRPGRRIPRKSHEHSPASPLQAIISDGVRVLIGGNGRQNDRISLRLARPDDLWLHAKDVAGAHVLVPRNQAAFPTDSEPPAQIVAEAAALAAYFSKAGQSSNVAVDWTLAKHVRKPRGARPGMVVYDHHRTVYVTPDEKTVSAQLARGRGDAASSSTATRK